MGMNPASRCGGLLLAALALAAALATSCATHGAPATASNPTVKAVVFTVSQWGQCLAAAGENLHQTL